MVDLLFRDGLFCDDLALHRAGGQAGDSWLSKGSVVTAHQFDRADVTADPVHGPDRLC
jgi:hypothetical protein